MPHVIWATWDSVPTITDAIEPRLFEIIGHKFLDTKCELLAINGVADHVHVLAQLDPSVAVADLVQQLKESSARLIARELGPGASFRWQGSYSAFSVSPDLVPAVAEYIRDQKAHHAAGTLKDVWEQAPILPSETPAPARHRR